MSSANQNRFRFNAPTGFDDASYFFDRVSGNTWRRCDLGKKYSTTDGKCVGLSITASWPEAVAIVQKLNEQSFEGSNDWRLPTRGDLASLLLNETSFKEIQSMRHHQYGFGASDWYAKYENNLEINYGGYYGGYRGPGEGQCKLTGQTLGSIFGSANGIEIHSAYSLPPKSHYRWMSDNYKWSNGQKLPPESKDWQQPRSFDFTYSCMNILNAFYKDTPDAQLAARLVSHAELPITIVRGGNVPQEWIDAQLATKNIETIIARSKSVQNERLNSVASFYSAIGNKIKDTLASATSANSTTSNNLGSGKRYSCSFLCRGSLFSTGARHTVDAFGSSETSARESIKDKAEKICIAENHSRGGAWWADMSICKEQ